MPTPGAFPDFGNLLLLLLPPPSPSPPSPPSPACVDGVPHARCDRRGGTRADALDLA